MNVTSLLNKENIMKRFFCLILVFMLCLASCKSTVDTSNDRIKIVTTIFPEYDFVRNVIGENTDNFEITVLTENGSDLHSFQPSADDIIKISQCDVFIYVGGESDKWVDDALQEATNRNMKVLSLMELLKDSVKEEETVEGMQEEHEEHEEIEYDEHVWLSVKNAIKITGSICDAICKADEKNTDTYKANLEAYQKKLMALDAEYENTISTKEERYLIFADRFPFRYLTDDYGIEYYAAFAGCSAESEADFETVAFLAEKLTELPINSVIVIDGSDAKIAKTVIASSNKKDAEILYLDSMQSITKKDIENGANYIDITKNNLETIKKALG